MAVTISAKIDTSGLNRGIGLAMQYSKRTPAQMVNTVALEVAYNAKFNMPFVTAARIDTELGVDYTARIGLRGKPLSTKQARNRKYSGNVMGTKQAKVPLAALIIMARAKPGSNYNVSTNNRYALAKNPFKGFSRALGAFKMTELVNNMIRGRRGSGNFLMAGWTNAINIMRQYSVNKYRRGGGPPVEGGKNYYGAPLGDAKPARQGETTAICIIENLIGYEGKNAFSFNKALQLKGAPVLQQAIDGEGVKQMNYYLKKSSDVELVKPFNDACK